MPGEVNPDTNFKITDRRSSETQARKAEMADQFPDSKKMVLKPCPFCKQSIRLQLCDSAGNFRGPEYADNPWGRLGFQLIHEVKDGECPIATHDGESLGSFIYDTREQAAEAWNRRASEPGTSVVRWVKYDGTPETLPERMRNCLFVRPFCHGMMIRFLATGNRGWVCADGCHGDFDKKIGDLWAYLPELPEGP